MRVGIDITALTARHTGVDRYLVNLVQHLAELPTDTSFYVFINREDRPLFSGKLPSNFKIIALCLRPRPFRLFFQQIILPIATLLLRLDVVHSPSFIMPMVRGLARHVLTVHDMTTITMPDFHIPLRRSRLFSFAVLRSIRNTDLLCVPSESVKGDVEKRLDGSHEKLRIVRYGVEARFSPRAADAKDTVASRLGMAFPYILYVGTIEPRKNLPTLIKAFAELLERRDAPEHLVLAGPLGWDYEEVLELVRTSRGRVHLPGFIPEDDLPALIAGARLFVYPSLREGFGFPPLEAMACGVPVVATRTSSLEENLDGAAELVPINDVAALRDAMDRALRDETLRAQLRARGLECAARFTWQETARAQLAAYGELVHHRHESRSTFARRTFLLALAGLVVAALTRGRHAPSRPKEIEALLPEGLDPKLIAMVSRSDRARCIRHLNARLAALGPRHDLNDVRACVLEDYRNGDTVSVDGWQLSTSLVGLISLATRSR